MTNEAKRNLLTATLSEGLVNFKILGFVCFWNIRSVDITKDELAAKLTEAGLDPKMAKDHNYRSAFLRALKNLEEQRIIRLVEENRDVLSYQFTAERNVDKTSLEYDRETIVVIDKNKYRKTEKFEDALAQGRDDIKAKITELFYREKTRYRSPDITRFLQKIFTEQADIINLREQGSVYFVPAGFKSVIDSVSKLMGLLGGMCRFEYMPMPDVGQSRKMVKSAVVDEVRALFTNLEKEIKEAAEEGKTNEKWVMNKLSKIEDIRKRISIYEGVLAEQAKTLDDDFAKLTDTLGVRALEI